MNAPVTIPNITPEAEVDACLGFLLDLQSYGRIISAWRSGSITDDLAKRLIHECGLGRFHELASSH